MDNFITLNYLGSFVGMVAVVVLITQFTKDLVDKYLKQIPTKYVVFIYALIVILGYQFMSNTFNPNQLLLTLLNAILLTMTAQGGYEWLYKPIEVKYAAKAIDNVISPVTLASDNVISPVTLASDTNIKENYSTDPLTVAAQNNTDQDNLRVSE